MPPATPTPAPGPTTIDLVYFNAGGGHRASALALQSALARHPRHWRVRLVNLFEVLDPQDRFRKMTGSAPEDWYNKRLARGWTIGMAQELKLLQGLIRLGHTTLVKALEQHWLQTEPDLVVSLVPNFNRAMFESLASTLPGVPYTTVLTDLADIPPHFWIERGQPHVARDVGGEPDHQPRRAGGQCAQLPRQLLVVTADQNELGGGSQSARNTQHGLGAVAAKQHQRGGPGRVQAQTAHFARAVQRRCFVKLGADDHAAGGVHALGRVAQRVGLRHCPRAAADEVLRLADFFIGKPGPGSISEAVRLGLPVIVVDNAWTMPQERYNAQWVTEHHLGIVHRSFKTIDRAVDELLTRLDEFRAHAKAMDNQALFEIPDILDSIVSAARHPGTALPSGQGQRHRERGSLALP